jgi:chromosome partitioning protein
MTITISTINLKGGACKTSTILNLAAVMKEGGRSPVLIDCDLQQSATQWAAQGGEAFPFHVAPIKIGRDVKRFKEKLDAITKKHKADTILFDTPPQLETEAMATALLADIVLVPVSPSPLDLWACKDAIAMIKTAKEARQDGLPLIILVPSRLILGTVLGREINGSLGQFNELISPSITSRVVMVEAAIAGLPINLYKPGSPSHKEFKNLMKFVLSKIRK